MSDSARDREAAYAAPPDLTPFSVGSMSVQIPAHQMIIFRDQNYRPDPKTGFSRWPIPGTQGARHPFRETPWAEAGLEKQQ